MKSLKDYSLNLTEEQYHAYPAWSYSMIAKYAKDGFGALKTIHEPTSPTPSMEFGTLFDTIITSNDFDSKYVVSDTTPSPAEKNVLDYLLSVTKVPFYEIPTNTMEDAISTCSYYPKWKYPTQYSHIEEARDYYEKRRTGKKIISQQDYNDAMEMANNLWSNPKSGEIFKKDSTDDIEYIYQAKFKVTYHPQFYSTAIELKIMPDLLIVNHKEKTITPVDLKTSTIPGYDFKKNFVDFRYDIQANLYTDVLKVIIKNIDEYKDYTIDNYVFVDISRSDKVPVSYWWDPSMPLTVRDYTYKGWKDLLNEILYYESSQSSVPSYIKPDELNDLRELINSPRQ